MQTQNQISLDWSKSVDLNDLNKPDRSEYIFDQSGGHNLLDYLITKNHPARQTMGKDGKFEVPIIGDTQRVQEVASTSYVSREQALSDFKDRWQDNTLIMQGLEEIGSNPFPAALNIKAKDPGQYGSIAHYLTSKNPTDSSGTPIIDKINYQENKLIIDRLSRIIPTVEKAGSAVAIVFVIVAIIVVFNTIRLIIYTARDEISVMKLVGASNTYVRGPFVVSGIMYGIVSGIITLILMAAVAYWSDLVVLKLAGVDIAANFQLIVNILSTYFAKNFGQIFSIIMGMGIILGGVSSYIAARRYLKV